MLKVKDEAGEIVAILKDEDSKPELTEAGKEKAAKKSAEKEKEGDE